MVAEQAPTSRWSRYLADWRTLPGDALLGYRNDGLQGVWFALAERSVHRLARTGRMFVLAHPLDGAPVASPPQGVNIALMQECDWTALSTLVGRRELARFQRLTSHGRKCVVAWRGAQPVGYAWLASGVGPDVTVWPLPFQFPDHAAYLYNLYVLPSERNSGIGSALATARLHLARQLGFREGWRMVSRSNTPSLRIARKSTTRVVGEVRYIKLLNWTYGWFRPHTGRTAELR